VIYLFDNIASFSDELFWRSLKVLPEKRVEKAMKFRKMIDRKLSVIAYLLLVYGLKKEYGIFEELIFGFRENEKPYLTNYPDIFFNISHCKYGVVCAISRQEVGIDIEGIESYDDEVAKYICNDEEYNNLIHSKNPAVEFCKLWTVKESVLKFTGEGICTDLKSVLHNLHVTFETLCSGDEKYVVTVCEMKQ